MINVTYGSPRSELAITTTAIAAIARITIRPTTNNIGSFGRPDCRRRTTFDSCWNA